MTKKGMADLGERFPAREEFVTVSDAARLLGISSSTIQRLVDNGTLSSWKTSGGHRRILRAPLEALIGKRSGGEKPMPVMVCDRHAGDRESIEKKLASSRLPLAIYSTGDWLEAIVIATRYHPEVWIIDPDFPDVDIWALTDRLFRLVGDTRTGIVLASRQQPDEHTLDQLQGAGFVVYGKPLPVRELQGMLADRAAIWARGGS